MTYICGVDSMVPKPRLFEREKTEELVHKFADDFHPSLTPCPDLGSNQIEDRDIQAFEVPCETEMKIGAVREKRGVRTMLFSEADQLPVFPINPGQVTGHFSETNYAQLCGVDYRLDACRFQFGPRRSKKFRRGISSR